MPEVLSPGAKPDGRRLRGDRTRQLVLAQAIRIAASEGLEGITFGRVAQAAGVPKSTLQVLFKDRETLQAQTLTAGAEAFAAEIRKRLPVDPDALERLQTLCDAWFDLVGAGARPGGCMVTAAAAEYRARPGVLQALALEHRERWRSVLLSAATAAQRAGALRADVDLEQLVFEILAFQGAANIRAGALDATESERARRAVKALIERSRSGRGR
jgi:AcrR family transcriptional regulator